MAYNLQIPSTTKNIIYKKMKKLLKMLLLLPISLKAQEKTVKVYEYENGVRKIAPKIEIKIKEKTVEVYQVDKNGIKEPLPTKTIEDNKVYNINQYGIKELFPEFEIE